MVGPSLNAKPPATIKFLCSYGGKIIPRHPDGKLRYHGGDTRVLAVDRFISFAELLVKLGELCGASEAVGLRCQLPKEDLDALVSITSDEDLSNLIEEHDRAATLKIRVFLSMPKKLVSPITSSSSSSSASSSKSLSSSSSSYGATWGPSSSSNPRCHHRMSSKPVAYPVKRMLHNHVPHGIHGRHVYLVHSGNHWQ